MKLSFQKAKNILNTIVTPIGNGQFKKSDLAKAKGDVGLKAYHLRHDIREAFKAHIDQEQTIGEQFDELVKKEGKLDQEKQEIEGRERTSKKDRQRLKEIASEKQKIKKQKEELDEEYKDLNKKEETVKLTKDKWNIDEVKDYLDSVELEILEDFIDFSEKKKK